MSNAQDQDDPVSDHTESVGIRAIAAIKLGIIYADGGFGIRFPEKSMSIEEVSLTKPYTVSETRLSDVLTA